MGPGEERKGIQARTAGHGREIGQVDLFDNVSQYVVNNAPQYSGS